MKVLVVDDDVKRREKLKLYVDNQNIPYLEHFTCTGSVDEAKKYLKSVYYDLLILDVVLPKRDYETASSSFGLALLDQLTRSLSLKKPGAIIGITAHLEDIAHYKNEFEKKCHVVIEAPSNEDAWKKRIVDFIRYNLSSTFSRTIHEHKTCVLTVHGIQTFGQWQNRLKKLTSAQSDGISFINYKYGYFSALAFLVPPLRQREVKRLANHLKSILDRTDSKRFVIFSHSFGTFLTINSIKSVLSETAKLENLTLVLSGSVLECRQDFGFLRNQSNICIINECGDRDLPLCAASAFVLGVGMAGRLGFYGMNDSQITNRYFKGGHSLYFENQGFMSEYWLPIILNGHASINEVDYRISSFWNDSFFEKIISMLSKAKPFIYMLSALFIAWFIF